GSLGNNFVAVEIATSMVLWATAGGSGLPFLFSEKGKLKRNVAILCSASDWDSVVMKGWFIPAPAPWASTMMHLLSSGINVSAETEPIEGEMSSDKDRVFKIGRAHV